MGGYHLDAPGYPSFPLNANQLFFVISKGYVDFSMEDETDIDDRNKRDGLARSVVILSCSGFHILNFSRLITISQVLVFLVISIVRASQHLAITSLEVTTLAFIFAMVLASWFWKDKPQDVNKPIILRSRATIADILTNVRGP